jgi:5S rRNA maturation endonuclease (ribonuclease M5)
VQEELRKRLLRHLEEQGVYLDKEQFDNALNDVEHYVNEALPEIMADSIYNIL